MPELPDIVVYLEALDQRMLGATLEDVKVYSPFLVRTYDPPIDSILGKKVRGLRRLGKRIVVGFEDDLWVVLHLMIAGRLHWKPTGSKPPGKGKSSLATLRFSTGILSLTEAGSKHRASLHLVRGEDDLRGHDPGGVDVPGSSFGEFFTVLRSRNHTLKRALTDPRLFSGIGNAYSDEILHRAGLSPFALTGKLLEEEARRLHGTIKLVLLEWTNLLRRQAGGDFPEKVTAFRPEMAVHGRFGLPCPVCAAPIQRIRYADNETNYCAGCQTGGRILADRSLSRLLKDDWPRSLEELAAS